MLKYRHQLPRPTLALCTALVCLIAASAAGGQVVATATPNHPGKGTRLHWGIDGSEPPISGQIPRSLTFAAPPGFALNTEAVAKRCTSLQAHLNECPSKSQIGSAVMAIHVTKPNGTADLPIKIKLYLGPKNRLMAVAFLTGVRVVPGTISGANGIAITFNPLPVPPVIQGVSYLFSGVTLDLGGTRTITHKVKQHRAVRKGHNRTVKGHKKPKQRLVRKRVDLVTAPRTCASGAWALTAAVGLPDGTTTRLSAPVPC